MSSSKSLYARHACPMPRICMTIIDTVIHLCSFSLAHSPQGIQIGNDGTIPFRKRAHPSLRHLQF
jgi:hypothetical protein